MANRLDFVITEDICQALLELKQATGVGPDKLLSRVENVPEHLTARKIKSWLTRQAATARQEHVAFVFEAYRALPRNAVVKISRQQRRELRDLRAASGTGPTALLRGQRCNMPDGLSGEQIRRWLTGEVQHARRDHLDWTFARWRRLAKGVQSESALDTARDSNAPHTDRPDSVVLDDAARGQLHKKKDETGYGVHKLLKWAKDNGEIIPEGLTISKCNNWFSGQVKQARKTHLDWVLAMYDKLAAHSGRRLTLTHQRREMLMQERSRTGISQTALLEEAEDIPEGLSAAMITRWINGYTKTARADFYDYVLSKWRALPDGI